ncbi:unnamed protein product [Candida verbasci]|uniref:Nuclear protein localization protein 4 n=1 Tax=Candida verbasci TaxID=1227364 RepID=A0A9W4XGF4_9ASCO|nr:unnamed protein product [Candida verbasci]
MILRFRSNAGQFRLTVNDSDLFDIVILELNKKIPNTDIYIKYKNQLQPINQLQGQHISNLFKNGDLIHLDYKATKKEQEQEQEQEPKSLELPIDQELNNNEGLIKRSKSNMCRHGDKGMCDYCSPLPPWDEDYRKEHSLKHINFHSYVKQQLAKSHNGSSYIAPLQNPNFKINLNCNEGHKPYPKGICSKCQPSAITLQLQKFRMVDHVEFSDSSILNDFINIWRNTGVQRFGYLYGRYEKFEKIPLGIKAVVEAIYEPPQHDEVDGITLLQDINQIDEIAKKLGLYKVGITFTDLTDAGDGKVICKRHKDSYFLTNLEILMASKFQIKYPNKTKWSNDGEFSSKFVTCVISGGLRGEIEPRSYQVSTSGEALVKADLISGCTQPSQIYINKSNDTRYVPDIKYSKINEYGLEVKYDAKPSFPVEFLLVSLSDSFPLQPNPMFTKHYPIENRELFEELQNMKSLHTFIQDDNLFNFHFLIHLSKLNILNEDEFTLLTNYITTKTQDDYHKLVQSNGWMTLLTIIEQSI